MSTNAGPHGVTSGLVGYWDAGNTKSYPGSGTTWTDLSGYNNHATLVNSPTFSNGALTFNGSNQYITIPFNTGNMPSGAAARTLITTFNASEIKDQDLLGVGANGIPGSRSSLYLSAGGNIGTDFLGSASVVGTVTYSTGTWYQLALSLPASVFTTSSVMYLNGVQFAVTGGLFYVFNTSTAACVIGTIPDYPNTAFFHGQIANSMLYNRALTAGEIAQIFHSTRGRYGI